MNRRIKAIDKADSTTRLGAASVYFGDALDVYDSWLPPTCIIADGPYGLGLFPGEAKTPDGLADWYAPHAAAWARLARPNTTLWFWNSEIGWAKAHPALEMHGWEYQEAVVWNKGLQHVAGNVNSKTIRGTPVVTEIAVRYTKRLTFPSAAERPISAKEWLRKEWMRSGLPLSQSNLATGTANAATRKYLTQCHLWYFPPGDAVAAMASWCEKYGVSSSRPYFSLDGTKPITAQAWDDLRAKWFHEHGVTNVWEHPPVHNSERVKVGSSYVHANQKPLALMRRQILACTEPGDVVWEPFGGLCSATVAALFEGRRAHAAELNQDFVGAAIERIKSVISGSSNLRRSA
ncbi:site-specific DNA-methyltransferase [Xanthomonas translucens pv. undulosa]|nr:site-specific DNA-methyltransferase [Xanthomonas translucens pv. translucens]QSQ50879.1 site-specific DNA-methyltransferase [Xanthomonas translucens pv. undulosa]